MYFKAIKDPRQTNPEYLNVAKCKNIGLSNQSRFHWLILKFRLLIGCKPAQKTLSDWIVPRITKKPDRIDDFENLIGFDPVRKTRSNPIQFSSIRSNSPESCFAGEV